MSTPERAGPVSAASVVAIILGLAGLVLIPVTADLYPLTLVLAAAAILIATVASINGRRANRPVDALAMVGGMLGAIGIAIVLLLLAIGK